MKFLKYFLYLIITIFFIIGVQQTVKKARTGKIDLLFLFNFKNAVKFQFSEYKEIPKIDKVFVLNLDRSPDRFQKIKKRLAKLDLGLDYERFSACDGKDLKYRTLSVDRSFLHKDIIKGDIKFTGDLSVDCGYDVDIILPSFNYLSAFAKRIPGEIGCFCSHRALWKKIIDSDYDRVLVIEDDVEFKYNAKNLLENALRKLDGEYDILYLGFTVLYGGNYDKSTESEGYVSFTKDVASTESYIITNKAAEILYQYSEFMREPIDVVISNVIRAGILRAYGIWPRITRQAEASVIG